jgi:MoxR-like ATPase
MLARACRAAAVLDGRDYVLPDDVKRLARPVLRHRVLLAPAAEMEGATADAIVDEILDAVAPPR